MTAYSLTDYLTPLPPFDFSQTLHALRNLHPVMGEPQAGIGADCFSKALMINGEIYGFVLSPGAKPDEGQAEATSLACTVYGCGSPDAAELSGFAEKLSCYLGLTDDLSGFYAAAMDDPVLKPILKSLYGYHPVRFPSAFEAACWTILLQRNLFGVATRMKQDLVHAYGDAIEFEGNRHLAFPEPERIARIPLESLTACLQDSKRAGQVYELALAFSKAEQGFFSSISDDELLDWLSRIPGIGPSSALYILNWGFARMQHAPLKDRKLTSLVKKLYGRQDMEEITARYGMWLGYWAHYLRMAEWIPAFSGH